MDASSISTGEVAKGARVGVETARLHEREGLVPAPKRRPSLHGALDARGDAHGYG
jgi:hypothetical protein